MTPEKTVSTILEEIKGNAPGKIDRVKGMVKEWLEQPTMNL